MPSKYDMSGSLFKNEEKNKEGANPNWADYKGSITINGVEYWLSGWMKIGQNTGKKFMSLSVKEKERGFKPKPKQADAIKDDLPW